MALKALRLSLFQVEVLEKRTGQLCLNLFIWPDYTEFATDICLENLFSSNSVGVIAHTVN